MSNQRFTPEFVEEAVHGVPRQIEANTDSGASMWRRLLGV